MSHEVIAYLTPDEQAGDEEPNGGRLQALVRLEDGSVALEDVSDEPGTNDENVTRFQHRVPIKDPQTNEVIGYEMEAIRRTS
jgi:hypothetical protein